MGAKPSTPSPPPPAPVKVATPPKITSTAPLPINSVSKCVAKKVELNQLNLDLTRKQTEVDTCDPAAAETRKRDAALAESRKYVAEKTAQYNAAYNEYQKQRKYVDGLLTNNAPLKEYHGSLTQSSSLLEAKNKKLEQMERRYRRNFLDNDPQSGVDGVPGIQTSDDKVMIVFWIGLLGASFMFSLILIQYYTGLVNVRLATIITAIILALAYFGVANYA